MTAERIAAIRQRLEAALAPQQLDVVDEGHKHIGHGGEGQGHFRVRIVSVAFAGRNAIARHRMVYAAVEDLIGHGIHALAIEARTPAEAGSQHDNVV
ncbi:MAG TPA: BolA family protein [Rhodanobacteraceae bacterium]|nr:BolA family protein [Rhodanobacteraceae bacterium]